MKKIRTLIIDDEPLAREGLATLLAAEDEVELAGQCADGESAVAAIQELRPDLIFLDIQMPKRDGFEALADLAPAERPVVIFVTAYDQHAIRAFEFCAFDYLLKPFTNRRFNLALARAKAEIRKSRSADLSRQVDQLLQQVRKFAGDPPRGASPPPAEPDDRVILKADGALHFVKAREVMWIEAQGDFVKVQTPGKTQLVRETLEGMERRLDENVFLRIHRSFLVNLEHVRRVEPVLYGDYAVYMSDGTKLRLSRSYRPKLKLLVRQVSGQ
jgi:two-component system LytT family response regulator